MEWLVFFAKLSSQIHILFIYSENDHSMRNALFLKCVKSNLQKKTIGANVMAE